MLYDSWLKEISLVVTRDGCVSDTIKRNFQVVPEPSANFSASSTAICANECIDFTYTGVAAGPNQVYAWDFGAGAIPPTSSLPNPTCISYSSGGTKTVTLTVTYQGCTKSSTQQLSISAAPIVSAGTDKEFCEGDGGTQLNASVSGGTPTFFYNWWCDDPGIAIQYVQCTQSDGKSRFYQQP